MTVLEVLLAATGHLEKHGVESPRLNAEHLLAHTLGKKRLDLYLEFDRPLSDAERAPLRTLIRDRASGIPLQHLLGTAEFHGRSFLSDKRALIPRPETEHLVELLLAGPRPERVLDIGTGSGVLAITLALEWPASSVTAVDISSEALSLATENATRLGANITFHQADLFPKECEPLDLIVANLPYIPAAEIATLQREVKHDPILALDGGPDGLDIIRRLILEAVARLAPDGRIALEIGHDQAKQVSGALQAAGYRDIAVRSDYLGVERFVFGTAPA